MIFNESPQLRLNVDALDRNIARMRAWCDGHGVALAPHVKTTMSPQIVQRQLRAGARGVTVATTGQAARAAAWGASEILIANEVVDAAALVELGGGELADRTVRIFVDSLEGIAAVARVHHDPDRRLGVLLDVGTRYHGRTGVRDLATASALADAVRAAPGLRLDGVAGYEGVVPNDRAVLDEVDEHCAFVREVFDSVRDRIEVPTPIYSMGGSAFPDRVVRASPERKDGDVLILLRSGCYVTHDHGTYAGVSPIGGLEPALIVRTTVVSRPEAGLAVLDAGKRDLAHDAGLPVMLSARHAEGRREIATAAVVRNLYDHHAVLHGELGDLGVGDLVHLGISHPCSEFDRWPEFVVVDDAGSPCGVWTTDFGRSARQRA